MVKGAGPDTEFLHVVAHGSHLARVRAGGFLEIRDDLLDGAEWNQVTKNFLAGDEANGLPMILGDIVGKQFVRLEHGAKKVNVVETDVADVRFRKNTRESRLPDMIRTPAD